MLMTLKLTQLFISFAASDFSANILHFQAALTCLQLDVLSLNQVKTEFLLTGLPAQLSKIADPALLNPSNVTVMPTDSARNLEVILTRPSQCRIIPQLCLNLVSHLSVTFEE